MCLFVIVSGFAALFPIGSMLSGSIGPDAESAAKAMKRLRYGHIAMAAVIVIGSIVALQPF